MWNRSSRLTMVAALTGISLLALTGCPNQAGSDVLGDLVGPLPFSPGTLTLRAINSSAFDSEVELLIDGEAFTLTCDAADGTCDSFFSECPDEVQLIQQSFFDDAGNFNGGRRFTNVPEKYTYTADEFCGAMIAFRFNFDDFKVSVFD